MVWGYGQVLRGNGKGQGPYFLIFAYCFGFRGQRAVEGLELLLTFGFGLGGS